jgi:hypothetical protein
MPFVVESGLGLPDSNGYISVASFKAYHDDRGNSYATYSDALIEKAIVRASDYLDTRFSFIGIRRLVTQKMEWPRYNAFYHDGRIADSVPIEIAEACAEYALRSLAAALAPDPVSDTSGRMVTSETKEVGPISTSKTFARGGSATSFKPYPIVDATLKELVNSGNRVLRG